MMTRDHAFDIGHPAPGRSRAVGAVLVAVVFAGFIAWSLQFAAGSAIAGLACLETDGTRPADADWGWAGWGMILINLLALAVAIGGIVASVVLIRRTGEEDPRPESGVMRAGEGRARSMAVWGLFANTLFLFAIGFNTISVFWGGLCPG